MRNIGEMLIECKRDRICLNLLEKKDRYRIKIFLSARFVLKAYKIINSKINIFVIEFVFYNRFQCFFAG